MVNLLLAHLGFGPVIKDVDEREDAKAGTKDQREPLDSRATKRRGTEKRA